MENLVAQVPELKLKKKTETRTIHWSDVRENKNLEEGMVIYLDIWYDDKGTHWGRSDILYHMKLNNLMDKVKNNVEEMELVN